jgi:hypothetical protein
MLIPSASVTKKKLSKHRFQDFETSYPSCGVSRVRFVLLYTYPAVLLVLSFCYGVSVLKIKTNYHEGRWITAATISMMPVYVVWSRRD